MDDRFAPDVVSAAARDLVIGVRVGESHRFIAVWAVVVDERVFARSWARSPQGWRAQIDDGDSVAVEIGGSQVRARARFTTDEPMNAKVDEAYRAKYHTKASAGYVADLTSGASRESTVEFLPVDTARPE